MIQPFHLSFVVPNKEKAKEFYLQVLGCTLGRDNETWFDIIFFGHQITIHQSDSDLRACKIDHFGPVLNKDEWLKVSEKLQSSQYEFILKPTIARKNQPDESGKFMVSDPSGNVLEFKYYLDINETVKKGT